MGAPTRFGYKTAAFVALGFAGFAAWPYVSTATTRLSQGKPVTTETVKKEVEKSRREYEKKNGKNQAFEPKAVLALADGTTLLGGKPGLVEWRDGQLTPAAGFDGMEVRGLVAGTDGTIWAAAKDGLWKRSGTQWQQVHEGDFHGVSLAPDGSIFLAGKMGVLRSRDGAHWEPLAGTETDWKPEHDEEGPGRQKGTKPKKEREH